MRSSLLPTSPSPPNILTILLFLLGKSFHVFALFIASDLLHSNELSLLFYTCTLLGGSGLLFLFLTRSLQLIKYLNQAQFIILMINACLLSISLYFYSFGLAHCGPIRTILIEFCDHLLLLLPAFICGYSQLSSNRKRGLLLVLLAVILLLFTQEKNVHDNQNENYNNAAGTATDTATVTLNVNENINNSTTFSLNQHYLMDSIRHHFHFLVFDVSEGVLGMLALLFSAGLSFIGKQYEKKHAKEFGGRKRLHAVSMCMGAILLIPLVIFQSLFLRTAPAVTSATDSTIASSTVAAFSATVAQHSIGFWGCLLTLLFLIIFFVVLQFYVDALSQRADQQLLAKLNLVCSFLCAAFIDYIRGESRLSIPTIIATALIFFGTHNLISSNSRGNTGNNNMSIPLYNTGNSPSTTLSQREFRQMMRHFMSDRTSMRIFTFLSINFLFMFVELIYGFYSNSLGLISDAGHMLFDCTALAIGLYASFVSKIKANNTYTYGYGRYEIISGYVNGVFLLFIGYFVFVESVERLFRPPEITSDSLVLVSFLGLCVNMVGLFFFHDHHGGGGHNHSHGGASNKKDSTTNGGHHGHSHASNNKSGEEEDHRNHNIFAIYLHILADTLGSVGVIISSLMVQYWNWTSADAICSIIISLLIIGSVFPLIESTASILLQCTPKYKTNAIHHTLQQLSSIPGVIGYRNPHFWLFSDKELVGTIVMQISENSNQQQVLSNAQEILRNGRLAVTDLTVQVEKAGGSTIDAVGH